MSDEYRVPNYFFNQSGVIPYRIQNETIEILLITSSNQNRWVIPKGVIEPGMSASESAIQEAWEEAGIRGQVSKISLGSYKRPKWGGICQIEVFLLEVKTIVKDWPEANFRERRWLSPEEAARRVDEEKLKQMIMTLPELLA